MTYTGHGKLVAQTVPLRRLSASLPMDCAECERRREQRDRMELAYMMALKVISDNPEGDARQQMLLTAMAIEAKSDLDSAIAELWRHRDGHIVANASA